MSENCEYLASRAGKQIIVRFHLVYVSQLSNFLLYSMPCLRSANVCGNLSVEQGLRCPELSLTGSCCQAAYRKPRIVPW